MSWGNAENARCFELPPVGQVMPPVVAEAVALGPEPVVALVAVAEVTPAPEVVAAGDPLVAPCDEVVPLVPPAPP